MTRVSFWPARAAIALAGLVVTACPAAESERTLRIAVHGVREGEPLEPEGVGLDNDFEVFAALLRVGRLTAIGDGAELATDAPFNLDLFRSTILVDGPFAGDPLREVVVEIPTPTGNGVLPGESVAVFVAGVVRDTPFELRDASLDTLRLPAALPLGDGRQAAVVDVELEGWFDDVDERVLVTTGGVVRLDATHNTAAWQAVRARILLSFRVHGDALAGHVED